MTGPLRSTLETRARVIATLTASGWGLDATDAEAILVAARAHTNRPLRELDGFLAAHPEALRQHVDDFPLAWMRVAHELRALGHQVPLPGCATCGAAVAKLHPSPAGRVCAQCAPRRQAQVCARCGQPGEMTARRPEGSICRRCYRTDPDVVADCARCGRRRAPVARTEEGRPICTTCWGRPIRVCTSCGTTAQTKSHGPDGPLCAACYQEQRRPTRVCARCGQLGRIASRGLDGDTCVRCYRRPTVEAACSVCGRMRICQHTKTGTVVCRSCAPFARHACARCGRSRIVAANWPLGPVCHSCYTIIRTRPQACGRCHRPRAVIARDCVEGREVGICGPCAGVEIDYRCSSCDSGAGAHTTGRCARCVLRDRLADLLAGPDGHLHPALAPLVDTLGDVKNPLKALEWLAHSHAARLLIQVAAEDRPISHDLLDELPPGHAERYLRQTLVATRVLPERNEDLERIPVWLDTLLKGRPTRHARLLRPFVTWDQLRRARRRTAGRTHTPSTAATIRRRARLTLKFLDWLDARGLDLGTLAPAEVEAWLTGARSHYEIRYFLAWAAARGLTSDHAVPRPPSTTSAPILDEHDRWHHLRRCLHDHTVPQNVRLAGTLILLFGIPASRVRQLTTDHVSRDGDRTYLHIGTAPLLLPPRVADLLHQQVEAPRQRSNLPGRDEQRWLFPGLVPGQPLTRKAFDDNLTRHGIHTRAGRNAALIALAHELPVPVLAELLGVHVHTAQKWAAHVQRDWATYLAARTTAPERTD